MVLQGGIELSTRLTAGESLTVDRNPTSHRPEGSRSHLLSLGYEGSNKAVTLASGQVTIRRP
jgi:hypothetical protein